MKAEASRTAVITCLMRTVHTKYDRPALIEDRWADQLVTLEERKELVAGMLGGVRAGEKEEGVDREGVDKVLHSVWHGMGVYGGVIIRTRYTEDHVEAAARRGVRQYVVIGAGLDSFGMRRPAFAKDLEVFEVDHGASQESKQERLRACGVMIPPTLHFVAADLGREELGTALRRSVFRFDEPAIFSWLGVTMYLSREANLATLRSIGQFAAPGSELVFTYIERRALESNSPLMQRARAVAAGMGEPWISGFDSATLAGELAAMGLVLEEDLGGQEMRERYCASRTDGFGPGRAGRIARARVIGGKSR